MFVATAVLAVVAATYAAATVSHLLRMFAIGIDQASLWPWLDQTVAGLLSTQLDRRQGNRVRLRER